MGYRAIGRKVVETNDSFILKETLQPFASNADHSKNLLCYDNSFNWQEAVAV